MSDIDPAVEAAGEIAACFGGTIRAWIEKYAPAIIRSACEKYGQGEIARLKKQCDGYAEIAEQYRKAAADPRNASPRDKL